jgi:hypothetical protein
MTALLFAFLRGRAPVPVARLRTRREGVRTAGAEVVDDAVAVLDGQRVTRRFRELEVELLEGDERTLRRLEKMIGSSRITIFSSARGLSHPIRAAPYSEMKIRVRTTIIQFFNVSGVVGWVVG